MLDLVHRRELLGKGLEISDSDLEDLRNELYAIAQVIIEAQSLQKGKVQKQIAHTKLTNQ